MRFYFQDTGQKVATKCIRVASDATVQDVIETLIEKFRPDMRMLSVPSYALYEVHSNHEERKLNVDEKPLLVQLNWHIDDREGRFLLRNTAEQKSSVSRADDWRLTFDFNNNLYKQWPALSAASVGCWRRRMRATCWQKLLSVIH